MYDIKIDENGDILFDKDVGDIVLTQSIRQQVLIKLRWIKEEWRLNEQFGLDYFGSILIKNPNLDLICTLILEQVLSVEGVTDAEIVSKKLNAVTRKADFEIKFSTGDDIFFEKISYALKDNELVQISEGGSSVSVQKKEWWRIW